MPVPTRLNRSMIPRLDALWVIVGTGIRALGQLLFTLILVRVAGPEGVGVYGVAVAWAVPITSFASLQLLRIQSTDRDRTYSFDDYQTLRYLTSALALIVILFIAWWLPGGTSPTVLGLGVLLIVASACEIFQGRLLQEGNLKQYGQSVVVVNSALWVTSAVALLWTRSMSVSFFIGAGVAVAVLIFIVKPLVDRTLTVGEARWIPDSPIKQRVKALARITMPLGLGLFVDSLASQVPRFILEHAGGLTELGIFVGLLAFLSVGNLVIESLSQPLTPRITTLIHTGRSHDVRKFMLATIGGLGALILVLAPLAYFLGPIIAGSILGPEFGESGTVLAILTTVFSLQFAQRVFSIVLAARKWTDQDLLIQVSSLISALIAGVFLIKTFGLEGAALTLLTVNVVRMVMVTWYVNVIKTQTTQIERV